MNLPPLTQEPKKFVDLSPNADLPVRILQAYLDDCGCCWDVSGIPESDRALYDAMNKCCEERAKILTEAIHKLQGTAWPVTKYSYSVSYE